MRDLKDYRFADWLRAEPLAQGTRRLRNILLDRVYGGRRAEGEDHLLANLAAVKGGFLAVTVAFNLPEAVSLLSQAMARMMPGVALLVCDNSSDPPRAPGLRKSPHATAAFIVHCLRCRASPPM